MAKNATMFNNRFLESTRFLMLPQSTKLLYFYLMKDADDDGIVDAYAAIRLLNVELTDFSNLVDQGFLVLLEKPLLGWLVDYVGHNKNLDLRYKRDSERLDLLAQVVPDAKIQVSLLDGKGKKTRNGRILSVKEYLTEKENPSTGEKALSSGESRPNITQPNISKAKVKEGKKIQAKAIEAKTGGTDSYSGNTQQHSVQTAQSAEENGICPYYYFLLAAQKLKIKEEKAAKLYEHVRSSQLSIEDVLSYYRKANQETVENAAGWFTQAIKEHYGS